MCASYLYSAVLFFYLTLLPEVLFCQTKPIFHNKLSLEHPRDTIHLPKLPFRAIFVLDGRINKNDAVGAYKTNKHNGYRFNIPLHLDTTLGVAANRYLNRWYIKDARNDSPALYIYLRKYVLFDGKVALGADVYVEKKGGYYQVFREDTLFRRHWQRNMSGGALDFLMDRVSLQWRKMGSEVSLKEIKERQDGLAWDRFPITHVNSTVNGVYLSIHDFLQARPRALPGVVDSITGNAYSWQPYHLHDDLEDLIPQGETIYNITFPKDSLKKYHWLRQWQRQPYAIASQNGALYLRLGKREFLKLAKVGNTFVANASSQLLSAFFQPTGPESSPSDSSNYSSYRSNRYSSPVSPSAMGYLLTFIDDAAYNSRANKANTWGYYCCNFERNGWHFYIDMDLGVVICY